MQDIRTAILCRELRAYAAQKRMEFRRWVTIKGRGVFIKDGKSDGKSLSKAKISAKNVTGKTAVIDKRKFTEYALDPEKQPDKAKAFKEALGFDKSNYQLLEKQIREKFDKNNLVYKMTNGQGDLYALPLMVSGVNGKTAKVMTGWIDDKNDKCDFHLTSVYVDK